MLYIGAPLKTLEAGPPEPVPGPDCESPILIFTSLTGPVNGMGKKKKNTVPYSNWNILKSE